MTTVPPSNAPKAMALVLTALFFSGTAGIVNQVVWQRALKLFLGGSDALSSLTVVLVFMAGLGAGSLVAASRASRLADPLRALFKVEVALALTNLAVAGLLALDLDQSVFAFQRFALQAGVPMRLLYVAAALLLLLPPCFLMGVTVPLSSEGCQRQLGARESRLITALFAVNTLGAVLGAAAGAFLLLPWWGQRLSLASAALGNLAAGALALWGSRVAGPASAAAEPEAPAATRARASVEDWAGFGLGFLSLGYEMLLFRMIALAKEPLPEAFATILCFFLLWWTLGVHAASRLRDRLVPALALAALLVAASTHFQELDRFTLRMPLLSAGFVYCVPALGFGLAYGVLVSRSARSWGRDVGRFSAFNTVGSCLGVACFVLVGYEMPPRLSGYALALGLLGVLAALALASRFGRPRLALAALVLAAASFAGVVAHGVSRESWTTPRGDHAYYDPDGVVEVDRNGNVIWDGLWHSRLAQAGDQHVGTGNWLLAAAPALAHRGAIEDALVIGLGTGITVGTVAKLGSLRQLDVYELNSGLTALMRDYPDGTLHVATNPKIRFLWQDGRTGLALSDKRYDLVTQQPLYLRQSGSSRLLSREYLELVKSRLKPGGVFAIYSSAPRSPSQERAVRDTVAAVFRNVISFRKGYMLVASDSPLSATPEAFAARAGLDDAFGAELRRYEETLRRARPGASLLDLVDSPALAANAHGLVITDDWPLVEYPKVTASLLRRLSD